MKRSLFAGFIGFFILPLGLHAQQAIDFKNGFPVCYGNGCSKPGYVNLSCSFPVAHPNDYEEQGAKMICTIQNNFNSYTWIRVSMVGGGQCGEVVDTVKCINK
jgi:hypothetical protein